MELKNSFSDHTRHLFLGCWECWECGQNGTATGGLELHHIKGRESKCALNASILCKKCHSHVGHTDKEHKKYLTKTIKFLLANKYDMKITDVDFYIENKKLYEI